MTLWRGTSPATHAERRNCVSNSATGQSRYNCKRSLDPGKKSLVRDPLETTIEKLLEPERDEMLFMLAARWADDIRTLDKAESRLPWHYVDFPFKPEAERANIQAVQPPQENILTAIASANVAIS
jgi:hypothetical protein